MSAAKSSSPNSSSTPSSSAMSESDRIYYQLLMAVKGNETCAKQRKEFAMCRATIVGRSGDPTFCDTQAAIFLQCYNDMLKYTQQKCTQEFNDVYQCVKSADDQASISAFMKEATGSDKQTTAVCQKALSEFKHC